MDNEVTRDPANPGGRSFSPSPPGCSDSQHGLPHRTPSQDATGELGHGNCQQGQAGTEELEAARNQSPQWPPARTTGADHVREPQSIPRPPEAPPSPASPLPLPTRAAPRLLSLPHPRAPHPSTLLHTQPSPCPSSQSQWPLWFPLSPENVCSLLPLRPCSAPHTLNESSRPCPGAPRQLPMNWR